MFAPLIFGVKGLLEFTQRGFINASKTFDNSHLYLNLSQKVIIITGANSGLGYSSAKTISKLKATVILVCRNNEAAIKARDQIISDSNNENVFIELCDLSKPASVALLVERIINNAGVLINERKETDGVESTFATNTLGTYHLTQLLIPTLKKSNGRVVTVSSGGMYNVSLSVDDLETKRPGYNGSLAYAQTKRAQVELTDYWSKKHPEILFYSMHPGWSSTEGIQKSLPALQSTLGSMLRTPEQGADTIVWAAVSNQVKEFPSASFFLDRKLAPLHLWLSGTRTEVGLVEKLVDKLDDYLSKI